MTTADWVRASQWSYQDEKEIHWKEWGFVSADETEYQRSKREEAEKRVAALDKRIARDKISEQSAIVIVTELLRVTRSPSKQPVYRAWLERHNKQ